MKNLGIIQQKVLFHANRTRSARYDRQLHIDVAIRDAINKIVKDRYDALRDKPYSFELFQRIKSELYTIVKSDELLVKNTSSAPNTFYHPDDYGYDIGLRVQLSDSTVKKPSKSQTFNERVAAEGNTLERPEPDNIKHREHSDGIEILTGGDAVTVVKAWLSHLRKPVEAASGPVLNNAATLVVGVRYFVNSSSILHDGNTYESGDDFVATDIAFSGSGTVYSIVNTDLPWQLHDEIAQEAAAILLLTSNNSDKAQALMATEQKN